VSYLILLDIAEDRRDAAERIRCEIYAVLQKVGRSPSIGHYHDELLSQKYRFWNFYNYVIAYAWQEKACPGDLHRAWRARPRCLLFPSNCLGAVTILRRGRKALARVLRSI
jgi:hypothetical protein